MNEISVIIPVRDEEKVVDELYARLKNTLAGMTRRFEVIFVTDVNKDNTFEALRRLNKKDRRFKVVKLTSSLGQHVAVMAGLRNCDGRYTVLMDGDLQDFPEDIPALYRKIKEGYDVVYAQKKRKNMNFMRDFFSWVFNFVMQKFSNVKFRVNSSVFRIVSRKALNQVLKFREIEPSLTYMFGYINLPTASVEVSSGARKAGVTKYSFAGLMRFAVSSLISFSSQPLYLISQLGFLIAGAALLYMIYILFRFFMVGIAVSGWATIVFIVLFVGGVQLVSIGVLGEYLGRIYIQTKNRPLYIIEEKIGMFGREEEN